jgi:hypothetical protein
MNFGLIKRTFDFCREYLIYKDFRISLIVAWIALTLFSILGMIWDMKELGVGLVVSVPLAPLVFGSVFKWKTNGRRLFFSKVGYAVFGLCLGLVMLSAIFNLSYESGWFDFTDLGFALLSMPLSDFVHFQFDNNMFSSRLLLYGIVLVNLIIVIYSLDFIGLAVGKIYQKLRRRK